jgi:serine/threonine protein kinase
LKICDFGIAHTAEATLTGRPFGTPPYMAPKQWRGEHVDARCDLYALGCVLYALLTGATPFPATDQAWVLMRRHLEEVPPGLRSVRDDVPVEVDRLVASLLAKNPADRPDVADVIARLTATGAKTDVDGPTTVVGTTTAPGDRVLVVLPALGESVTEGTVTRWLKREGDRIEADEPLLEVSTDKVDTEIPSPASGTLVSIAVVESQTAPVGATLATIDTTRPAQQH